MYSSINESVILLHGLARSERSLNKLAVALELAGYHIVSVSYPSTTCRIEKLAPDVINKALAKCPSNAKINFVTHSMGGILVRQYLSEGVVKNMGRVVMLGPPNKGSQIVDRFSDVPGFKLMNGPAGMQLGTNVLSVPNLLGSVNFELGVIAGNRSFNPILSLILPSPNDGKVSVENTKVKGMQDHIELPVTHTFMMNQKNVIAQVIYFLKHGFFRKN